MQLRSWSCTWAAMRGEVGDWAPGSADSVSECAVDWPKRLAFRKLKVRGRARQFRFACRAATGLAV